MQTVNLYSTSSTGPHSAPPPLMLVYILQEKVMVQIDGYNQHCTLLKFVHIGYVTATRVVNTVKLNNPLNEQSMSVSAIICKLQEQSCHYSL